jgi:hypothetical protein
VRTLPDFANYLRFLRSFGAVTVALSVDEVLTKILRAGSGSQFERTSVTFDVDHLILERRACHPAIHSEMGDYGHDLFTEWRRSQDHGAEFPQSGRKTETRHRR